MKYTKSFFAFMIVASLLISCGKQTDSTTSTTSVQVPKINGDSAFMFVKRQVDFGPRVPNSQAHKNTAAWLEAELKKYGAQVTIQSFKARAFDGTELELKNIIASFNPEKQKRIILAAHWDTRPFADKDSVKRNAPFDGANDGGSGVGVLLEVARQLQSVKPRAGIDIILFDGEDYGEMDQTETRVNVPTGWDDWWCLGSQYWSRNKHKAGYTAYYGILLDMVGAGDARFFREGTSMNYAPRIVDKVWTAASIQGYSDYFVKQDVGGITDDHYFVSENAKIPMVDIVQYNSRNHFGDFHHTTNDNMSVINKRTLEAVGNTVLHVVFNEE